MNYAKYFRKKSNCIFYIFRQAKNIRYFYIVFVTTLWLIRLNCFPYMGIFLFFRLNWRIRFCCCPNSHFFFFILWVLFIYVLLTKFNRYIHRSTLHHTHSLHIHFFYYNHNISDTMVNFVIKLASYLFNALTIIFYCCANFNLFFSFIFNRCIKS